MKTLMTLFTGIMLIGCTGADHQAMFASEKTLNTLTNAAFQNAFGEIPFQRRITHRGSHGFPDATFHYLFGQNVKFGKPIITQTNVSDHLPVTCDVMIQ